MANVDITKIVQPGQDKVKIYHKIVESQPTDTVTFADGDLVTYLSDLGDMGAEKDTQEIDLYHLANTAKITTGSTLTDLEFTEALTKDALDAMRKAYKDGSFMVTGMFDTNGDLLYGCFGQISAWGMTLPNGDTATLTYTLALSDDEIKCEQPSAA
jgi:hypothetical protein